MKARSRWSCVLACLGLAVPAAWAQAPAAEPAAPAASAADHTAILKVIPADATAFVAVSNLKALDAHVQGVAQKLQLQGMIPNLLDLFKSNLGITEGLNEDAGLAFVILSLAETKDPNELASRLGFLVPAADPEALIKSLGGQKQGEAYAVTMMGQASLAAPGEGFVIVAEKPETLKAMQDARGGVIKAMSPEAVKAFAKQDILAWAAPSGISKELRQKIVERINATWSSAPAATQPAAEAPKIGGQLAEMMEQLQEASLALSLDQNKGLLINVYTRAKSGTERAKMFAAMKGLTRPLLVGLPDEQVILAFGAAGAGGDPAQAERLDDTITQGMKVWTGLLSTAGLTIPEERLTKLKQPLVQLLVDVEQMALSLSALPIEGGEGRLGLSMSVKVKDSAAWKAEARKFFELGKELGVDLAKQNGQPEEKIQKIAGAVSWKDNAEQLDGISVDHFVVDLDKLAETDEEKAELDKVKAFAGKEGLLVRVAALGKEQVLITFGGGAPRFKSAVAAVKKDAVLTKENAAIKKVADRMPAGAKVIEGYLSLENLLNLISTTANQFGTPIPIPLALNNAAPIGLVCNKIGDAAQETTVLVPMELISAIKEMVGPMLMMMSPGGMPEHPTEPAPQPGGELN